MTKIEQIIKTVCVFCITMLWTSSIFFSIMIGEPSVIVVWFGFFHIPLQIFHIIALSISLALIMVIGFITFFQWKRAEISIRLRQFLLYFIVIGIGSLFVIATHVHLFSYTSMAWFILDILIIVIPILIGIFIVFSVWMARSDGREPIKERKYKIREMQEKSNRIQDIIYEYEKSNAHPVKKFFLNYIAHHFWVGVLLLGMGTATQIVNPHWNGGTAIMWFVLGIFLILDDTINHIFHKSITDLFPKRFKNERGYDKLGKFFTVLCIVLFLLFALFALYSLLILGY